MIPKAYYGVDFSGAKLAGHNTWVARCEPTGRSRGPGLRVMSVDPLQQLVGLPERAEALAGLVRRVLQTQDAVWAMDFPFSLPPTIAPSKDGWMGQLLEVADWPDGANAYGQECVRRARRLGGELHVRRRTDRLSKTPFDCYHYRIIFQTFHGMRDVLLPLASDARTAILPFQYAKLARANRVVMECCPSSLLKALSMPHQNYKQPAGGPLTTRRRGVRGVLRERMAELVEVAPVEQRRIDRNPGGDALDAVLAAISAFRGWTLTDHARLRRDRELAGEGWVYV